MAQNSIFFNFKTLRESVLMLVYRLELFNEKLIQIVK